jgi:hypothetical protein
VLALLPLAALALALALAPWRRTRPLVAPLVLVPLGVFAAFIGFWYALHVTPIGQAPQAVLLYGGLVACVALGVAAGFWLSRIVNRVVGLR